MTAVSRRQFLVSSAAALAALDDRALPGLLRRTDDARLLVPMDDDQQNHLKAYGLTYNVLRDGLRGEWLLNYRGGSFLLPDSPELRRRATLDGVTISALDDAAVSAIRTEIAGANMDSIPLEKAPTVAIYKPPTAPPWDDAVTLAVQYAGIPFTQVWDDDVLAGNLSKYDWIHLHHEDFTGQFNKLYLNYRGASWFAEAVSRDMETARRHGFSNVPALKKQVAEAIRTFVDRGGLLFAMCGATETLDLANAAHSVDIAGAYSDGTPMDPEADARMDWTRALAFRSAHVEMSPNINSMSDIDGHQVNVPSRKQPLGEVTLFAFSAKFDPVATMLVQDHRTVIPDFYGVTTSFTKATLKPTDVVLAYEEGAPWVKYIHGDYGKGSWTFLGGHDPEDPQHAVGNPSTDLALHPNSPGYRLILNNVLFPAAKKEAAEDVIAFPPDGAMMVTGRQDGPVDKHDDASADGECGTYPLDERQPLDPDDEYIPAPLLEPGGVAADLGPGGPIAVALASISGASGGGYEDRASQRAMAARIADLYNTGGVALLEAGTGVGKSLAYLVPALRWAALRGERTVVSTNTINLQEQLVGKDLPLLASALTDQPVRFALLKGWRNYLCLHRLEHAQGGGLSVLDPEQDREMLAIVAWAQHTQDGSLADAPQPLARAEVWDEVAAEPDLCLRQQCPHYDACFVFRARRVAAQADVVVVNHHLLMSDVVVRRVQHNWHEAAVIPAYTRLVVDEGHHLESAAAAHLGNTVTRRGWQRLLARLDRRGGKGLLARLAAVLRTVDDPMSPATVDLLSVTILPATVAARERGDLVFDLLAAVLADAGESQWRLDDAFARHPVWSGGLGPALDDLLGVTTALDDGLRLVQARHGGDQLQHDALARVLGELRGVGRRLTASATALREGLAPSPTSEPSVRWIERRRGPRDHGRPGAESAGAGANIGVCAVPLDLAPILREDLFKRVETAIVTSATLAAEGRFDFLAGRLGVDGPGMQTVTEVFPSPFDYTRQALLAVPTDIPAPNVDAAGHADAVVRIIRDLVRAAGGGIFVLFTSHRDVRAAADALGTHDPAIPIAELLVQGDHPRDALLRRFRACGNAVLLGTASFWEGVDVPGRALRALLIPRLPFRVPSEPLTAAQCERIVARGGDPFAEYMLPQASLRLNQGFGRLIRSTTDRGVVVLADPRIVTKGYGRDLLRGLPPAHRIAGPWRALRYRIESFFHSDIEPS